MADYIEVRSRSGLFFRMHPVLGCAIADFLYDPETNQLKMVAFPPDMADYDPAGAIELAKKLGYTQADDGAWCDPMLALAPPRQTAEDEAR